MSFWSRIVNVVRGDRLNHEIDEELASHVEEAIERGRDPAEGAGACTRSFARSRSARTPCR